MRCHYNLWLHSSRSGPLFQCCFANSLACSPFTDREAVSCHNEFTLIRTCPNPQHLFPLLLTTINFAKLSRSVKFVLINKLQNSRITTINFSITYSFKQLFDTDDVLDTSEIKSPRWCGGQVVQTLVAGTKRWSLISGPPKYFSPSTVLG